MSSGIGEGQVVETVLFHEEVKKFGRDHSQRGNLDFDLGAKPPGHGSRGCLSSASPWAFPPSFRGDGRELLLSGEETAVKRGERRRPGKINPPRSLQA